MIETVAMFVFMVYFVKIDFIWSNFFYLFFNFLAGTMDGSVGYNMSYFKAHNCLMIISTKEPAKVPEPIVAEDEDLETNTQLPDEDDEANVIANDRLPRQLNSPLGNANLGVGESPVEKHQYDVKKIANQVDTGKIF